MVIAAPLPLAVVLANGLFASGRVVLRRRGDRLALALAVVHATLTILAIVLFVTLLGTSSLRLMD